MDILGTALFLFALPFIVLIGLVGLVLEFFANILALFPQFILIVISYLLLVLLLGLALLPFKSWLMRPKVERFFQIIGFILFGPLVILIIGAIIALPFVMLFSLAESPMLWIGILVFIAVINLIYHNSHKLFNATNPKMLANLVSQCRHKLFGKKS